MKQVFALAAFLLAILGYAAWSVWEQWLAAEDVAIGLHGYLALAAGCLFTLLLGGGLMWLVFYSARRGYDDLDLKR